MGSEVGRGGGSRGGGRGSGTRPPSAGGRRSGGGGHHGGRHRHHGRGGFYGGYYGHAIYDSPDIVDYSMHDIERAINLLRRAPPHLVDQAFRAHEVGRVVTKLASQSIRNLATQAKKGGMASAVEMAKRDTREFVRNPRKDLETVPDLLQKERADRRANLRAGIDAIRGALEDEVGQAMDMLREAPPHLVNQVLRMCGV